MATRKTLPTKLKRKQKTVSILGCEMEFLEPSILQRAQVMQFIMESIARSSLPDTQRQQMTGEELSDFLKPKLQEFQSLANAVSSPDAKPEDQIKLLVLTGSLFSHTESNAILECVIENSFPQVTSASELGDDAIGAMFGVLMEAISPDESNADHQAFREALNQMQV